MKTGEKEKEYTERTKKEADDYGTLLRKAQEQRCGAGSRM